MATVDSGGSGDIRDGGASLNSTCDLVMGLNRETWAHVFSYYASRKSLPVQPMTITAAMDAWAYWTETRLDSPETPDAMLSVVFSYRHKRCYEVPKLRAAVDQLFAEAAMHAACANQMEMSWKRGSSPFST